VSELVEAGLERALCACDSVSSDAELTTLLLETPGMPVPTGHVGINSALDATMGATIVGTLIVAGTDGVSIGTGARLEVGGDFFVGGPLEGSASEVRVGGDAAVTGRIELRALQVSGTLTQPAGETLNVAMPAMLGALANAPVTVAPPCDCSAGARLDVVSLVQGALAAATELPAGPRLPDRACASYRLQTPPSDSLVLEAVAPIAIYVPGNLQLDGSLTLDTTAGAAVDVFVEGDLRIDGPLELGNENDGGPVRLHVGGAGTIQLTGGGTLHGALYAPEAELVLGAALEVYGALFVNRVAASSSALIVHHDPSVLR
jgi:hypothetical protein